MFHDLKLVFVHCEKTGGSSIEKALCDSVEMDEDREGNTNPKYKHRSLEDYKVLEGYTVFSVVRNPFDRLISMFYWASKEPKTTQGIKNWLNGGIGLPTMTERLKGKGGGLVLLCYEDLQFDFDVFMKSIGLDSIELPFLNKSDSRLPIAELIDEELRVKIVNLYKDDFEQFSYSTELKKEVLR